MTRKTNALESFETSVKAWRNLIKACNVIIYSLSQRPSESGSTYIQIVVKIKLMRTYREAVVRET